MVRGQKDKSERQAGVVGASGTSEVCVGVEGFIMSLPRWRLDLGLKAGPFRAGEATGSL